MSALAVNEIFDTIQGEGTHTGRPATFVRLQGCDVGCPWCDTKHTWARSAADRIPFHTMLSKTVDAPTHALTGVRELTLALMGRSPRHIVITGGEPCDFDLRELTGDVMMTLGRSVQVETSGTAEVRVRAGTWVTVSPKLNMPGGRTVRDDALIRADEIKMPVGRRDDIRDVVHIETRIASLWGTSAALRPPIWLQPLSISPKATAICIEAATAHGWRVSAQLHRYIGVR